MRSEYTVVDFDFVSNDQREAELSKKVREGFPRKAAHVLPAMKQNLAARIDGGGELEILVVWGRDDQAAVGRKQ